jgi:hypothetical protein
MIKSVEKFVDRGGGGHIDRSLAGREYEYYFAYYSLSLFTRLIKRLNFHNATKAAYTYSPTLQMNYNDIVASAKFVVKRNSQQNHLF